MITSQPIQYSSILEQALPLKKNYNFPRRKNIAGCTYLNPKGKQCIMSLWLAASWRKTRHIYADISYSFVTSQYWSVKIKKYTAVRKRGLHNVKKEK